MKPFKIIFEDAWLMVVDKAAGLLVIPSPKEKTRTLTNLLNRELAQRGALIKAHPCHRLDRETSGLIIFAKGKKAQKLMMEQFRAKKVEKKYLAFVQGELDKSEDVIKKQIWDEKNHRWEMALTKYRVLEKRKTFSVVEAEPITGRTNQIRIHFKQLGHPLLGERKFAFAKDFALKFKRLALHAKKLSFMHHFTQERLSFNSALPHEMESFLEKA